MTKANRDNQQLVPGDLVCYNAAGNDRFAIYLGPFDTLAARIQLPQDEVTDLLSDRLRTEGYFLPITPAIEAQAGSSSPNYSCDSVGKPALVTRMIGGRFTVIPRESKLYATTVGVFVDAVLQQQGFSASCRGSAPDHRAYVDGERLTAARPRRPTLRDSMTHQLATLSKAVGRLSGPRQ